MTDRIKKLINFIITTIRFALSGGRKYYAWLGALLLLVLFGLYTYFFQLKYGIITTSATDQTSWGLYIANFPFFVGVAAGAVMIVIPAYLYKYKEFKHITTFGETLAISAVIASILCILAMLGRIDRLWHIFPFFGTPNFPSSMLPWDVIVLNGYLFLNLLIVGYMLYKKYYNEPMRKWIYFFIFLSMPWALSIHTVTAFIIAVLPAKPFWHTALMAPRFLASAFTVGPVIMIVVLQLIRRYYKKLPEGHITNKGLYTLAHIALVALLINLFFLGSEVVTVGYNSTSHLVHLKYLFTGIMKDGVIYDDLMPAMWASVVMQLFGAFILLLPRTRKNLPTLNIACISAFLGILLEKGLILISAGFIPTPLGEIYEFNFTLPEVGVTIGIWALATLIWTLLLKATLTIESNEMAYRE